MKKNFLTAAENFISGAELQKPIIEEVEPEKPTPKRKKKAPAITIPKGYRLEKELKSERLQLLIRPTTKQALKERAAKEGISVNDLINRVLEEYTEAHPERKAKK